MFIETIGIPIAIPDCNRSVQMVEPIADFTFDFRGAIRWLALLKFTHTFRTMTPNQVIEVQGLDPDTRMTLLKVLPKISYELLGVEEDADTSYKLHLRKRNVEMPK
jgi:TusA-related sulfurtransferase